MEKVQTIDRRRVGRLLMADLRTAWEEHWAVIKRFGHLGRQPTEEEVAARDRDLIASLKRIVNLDGELERSCGKAKLGANDH